MFSGNFTIRQKSGESLFHLQPQMTRITAAPETAAVSVNGSEALTGFRFVWKREGFVYSVVS